ncbi:type II CAAX prenyl endopeptidase Rce1 family protein [Bacillus manliponensis]|uniref:CPBP family glutamic-type intramembrane protease n=1 Tax=Bacillus manliponensis TaxID=574376 RepID=UPI003515A24F
MKSIYKQAFQFSLWMLPIGILGGILVGINSWSMFNEEIRNQIIAQVPKEAFILILVLQVGLLYTGIMGFFGYILASKVNLLKKLTFTKRNLFTALFSGILAALLLFLPDYFLFSHQIPEVAAVYMKENFSLLTLITSVIYGGILEEIMMRLFVMSLLVFILWKLFARSKTKEHIPVWIFIIANIGAALLFAAGHLPATAMLFGHLDTLILIRCFILNSIPGLIFGWLYWKHGLHYAMIAHAFTHVTIYVILYLFIF